MYVYTKGGDDDYQLSPTYIYMYVRVCVKQEKRETTALLLLLLFFLFIEDLMLIF